MPMVSPRTDHESPPAPVAESWRRIEAWLDEHLPGARATLRPGVSEADLAHFEGAIGHPLPDDVRQSWLIHDGQCPFPDELDSAIFTGGRLGAPGLIFGQELNPLVCRDSLSLSGTSALAEWAGWRPPIVASDKAGPEAADEVDEGCTSFPAGAIRCHYTNRGWIPLVMGGRSNYLGIDLDPGPNGVVGQVIHFGLDEEAKSVLATSWGRFLEDFADELGAGNYVLHLDEEVFDDCDWLLLKRPRKGGLHEHGNDRAWSRAKLDPRFLRGGRTP
jgi:cell wall assembly regulator SMI1